MTKSLFESLAAGDLTSLTQSVHARQREAERVRRSSFEPLGARPDEVAPAATVYHRHSRLTPAFLPELSNEEMRSFTRAQDFKTYPGVPTVQLPKDVLLARKPLADVISARRTGSRLHGDALTLEQAGTILGLGMGITGATDGVPKRAQPSAGSTYPLDAYVIPFRVSDLAPALYHYLPPSHQLELIDSEAYRSHLEDALPPGVRRADGAMLLVWTIRWNRCFAKYLERGYRFALLEAGHAAQNVLLVATSMDLPCIPVGGFFDDPMNRTLGLDPNEESAVYAVLVGSPQ